MSDLEYNKKSGKKQAKEIDLGRISFLISDRKIHGLSNKSSAILSMMTAVYKLGYSGITACSGSIVSTLDRSGYSMSERTFFRGLAELQTHGFFTRKKFRLKHDHFQTVIEFIPDKFTFLSKCHTIQKKDLDVCEKAHMSHISSSLTKRQEYPLTSTDNRVNTPNLDPEEQTKPRARAGRFKNWVHPVLYSLMVVLQKSKIRDRAYLVSKARSEIEAERLGVTMAGGSGIEWNRPHWQEMPYTHREMIIRDEIVPALRATVGNEPKMDLAQLISETVDDMPPLSLPQYTIERLPEAEIKPLPTLQVSLNDRDLAILAAARDRALRRCI